MRLDNEGREQTTKVNTHLAAALAKLSLKSSWFDATALQSRHHSVETERRQEHWVIHGRHLGRLLPLALHSGPGRKGHTAGN